MSTHGRTVIRAIDQALATRDRHPTLFAAQMRNDRDCSQLANAVERYKREKPTPKIRPDHDEVERIDVADEERMARDREEHDRGRRLRLNRLERDRRMQATGLSLAAEVIAAVGTISAVAAGNIEPTRGGGDPSGPPRQQTLDDDPRWQLSERIIHRHALVLRELVDEARGLSVAVAIAALSAEEKDKTLREEGIGRTAEELFHALGPEYGSISYIRRKRNREWDMDTLGRPREA